MKLKMKSYAGFEPVPVSDHAPTPTPYQTLKTKPLFDNEKLKIQNLSFEFQNFIFKYLFIEIFKRLF